VARTGSTGLSFRLGSSIPLHDFVTESGQSLCGGLPSGKPLCTYYLLQHLAIVQAGWVGNGVFFFFLDTSVQSLEQERNPKPVILGTLRLNLSRLKLAEKCRFRLSHLRETWRLGAHVLFVLDDTYVPSKSAPTFYANSDSTPPRSTFRAARSPMKSTL